jgi:hypothetical protein
MKVDGIIGLLGFGPDGPGGHGTGPAPAPAEEELRCAWCEKQGDPDKDGFHVVYVAFGAWQERHVFCTEECYEAFRRMYPSRVHRDCYERNCAECDQCRKRYDEEADRLRLLSLRHAGAREKT